MTQPYRDVESISAQLDGITLKVQIISVPTADAVLVWASTLEILCIKDLKAVELWKNALEGRRVQEHATNSVGVGKSLTETCVLFEATRAIAAPTLRQRDNGRTDSMQRLQRPSHQS